MTNNELQHSELQRSERLAPYVASYRDADPLIPLIEVEQLVAHRTALHDPSTHTSWKKKIMFTVTSASLLTFAFLTVFNSGGDNASPVATQRSTSQTHEGQSRASSTTIANEPTAQSLRDDRTGAVSPTAAEDTDTSPDSIFAYYTLTENE